MRKGVSPLIAVVLLIAFTLAIGGFMSGWIQTLTSEQVEQVEENVKTKCNWAYINTKNEAWNSTGGEDLSFEVENIGTADIEIQYIQILYDNGTQVYGKFNATTLESNEILFVNISQVAANKTAISSGPFDDKVNDSLKLLRVTTDCPGLYVDVYDSQISGAV